MQSLVLQLGLKIMPSAEVLVGSGCRGASEHATVAQQAAAAHNCLNESMAWAARFRAAWDEFGQDSSVQRAR